MSPREHERARREIAASEHTLAAGRWDEAVRLLDAARHRTDDPLLRAHGERIRARVEILRGNPQAGHDRLVAIAESLDGVDPPVAAAAMTEAVVAGTITGSVPAFLSNAGVGVRAVSPGRW